MNANYLTVASLLFMIQLVGGCTEPARVPKSDVPYTVRLFGTGDTPLRVESRGVGRTFVGRAGRNYTIRISNPTSSDVGVSIAIDGLDSDTGEPVAPCTTVHGYVVNAYTRRSIDGFPISDNRIATYKFTRADESLASASLGARNEAVGTIDVCFFSLERIPEAPPTPASPESTMTFTGSGELQAGRPEPAVVGDVLDRPPSGGIAWVRFAAVLARVVLAYEDEDGVRLGTAPPPLHVRPAAHDRVQPVSPARERPAPRKKGEEKGSTQPTLGRKPFE